MFEVGQKVRVVMVEPLAGNEIAPALTLGEEKIINEIVLDREGHQHLDVGLASTLYFVRSWETKEDLPRGHKIHSCHPSRFELV